MPGFKVLSKWAISGKRALGFATTMAFALSIWLGTVSSPVQPDFYRSQHSSLNNIVVAEGGIITPPPGRLDFWL